MAKMNIYETIQIYSDSSVSSNPQKNIPDYTQNYSLIQVNNPKVNLFQINPMVTTTVFNGSVATTINGTTAFTTSVNPILTNTYRFTWSGGTNPTLKTNRNLALNGATVTAAINNNVLVQFTVSGGSFSGVVVGDTLWLPGPTTGDAFTPFNVLNQGLWTVIGVASSTSITATRLAGLPFEGASETQTLTSNGQFVAFAPTGIQIGNQVNISAGFSAVDFGTFTISNITPAFFEIVSSSPIALENNITPNTGLVFYANAKRFLRVETDQQAILQLNGDVGTGIALAPIIAGDPNNTSHFEMWGTVWSLTIINKSPGNILNATIISAE